MRAAMAQLGRFIGLLVLACLSLQLCFAARIALMRWVDPHSTTFQRSEAVRLLREQGQLAWAQQPVPGSAISDALRRAVIASEDANFADHPGVEWEALEKAWDKNSRAEARTEHRRQEALARHARAVERARQRGRPEPAPPTAATATPKVIGGSTITQQLAKNLFLSGERTLLRKAQEFMLTFMLEALLDKPRILDIYLNNVEWGEGVFGAQAAARHYFHTDARQLSGLQAARLAVMLPAPKRFEQNPRSAYVSGRAATIVARMGSVELP